MIHQTMTQNVSGGLLAKLKWLQCDLSLASKPPDTLRHGLMNHGGTSLAAIGPTALMSTIGPGKRIAN
ncbi:hypothetical protein ACFFYR_15630 [Paraburkholderia dipogonis]|uniref:hypothetical protein n=1 Tax=Paraburkholderia dipogonis TaxID=1211383 RepID=UPI0035ED7D08